MLDYYEWLPQVKGQLFESRGRASDFYIDLKAPLSDVDRRLGTHRYLLSKFGGGYEIRLVAGDIRALVCSVSHFEKSGGLASQQFILSRKDSVFSVFFHWGCQEWVISTNGISWHPVTLAKPSLLSSLFTKTPASAPAPAPTMCQISLRTTLGTAIQVDTSRWLAYTLIRLRALNSVNGGGERGRGGEKRMKLVASLSDDSQDSQDLLVPWIVCGAPFWVLVNVCSVMLHKVRINI